LIGWEGRIVAFPFSTKEKRKQKTKETENGTPPEKASLDQGVHRETKTTKKKGRKRKWVAKKGLLDLRNTREAPGKK